MVWSDVTRQVGNLSSMLVVSPYQVHLCENEDWLLRLWSYWEISFALLF